MRRHIAPFVVLSTAACSASPAPPPGAASDSPPVVALPIALREGLPDVEVEVGGQRFALMLDLGAGAAFSLSPSILGKLPGVSYTGREHHFANAIGDHLASREVVLDHIALGPLHFQGVTGQELVYAGQFAPPNRDGYVGRGLFAHHRLLVDYAARRLTLIAGAPQPVEEPLRMRTPVPVRIDRDGVVVEVTLDGAPARLVLDTGSTASVLRKPSGAPHPSRHDLVVGGERLPGFELVEVDAGPPSVDGILGRNFFEGRRVLLDFGEKHVWLDDAATPR